jgi:hypothetical protein
MISANYSYYLTIIIVGVGLVIKFFELIYVRDEFDKGKAYDWEIVGKDSVVYKGNKLFKAIYSKKGVVLTCVFGVSSFIFSILFFGFNPLLHKLLLAIFILCNILIYTRHSYGLDGADQMSLLILLTIFLSYVIVSPDNYKLGLYFIAGQLSLSYLISGGAKVISPQWRSGKAIQGILSTYTYGNSFTQQFFVKRDMVSFVFCWIVMLFEVLFPLLFFCDSNVLIYGLSFGVIFHFMIALTMGLNDFLWSFSAAYPAFYFASMSI